MNAQQTLNRLTALLLDTQSRDCTDEEPDEINELTIDLERLLFQGERAPSLESALQEATHG